MTPVSRPDAGPRSPKIDWMTIRDCGCENGRIESDYAPGTWYPCDTCNPNWSRIAFGQVEEPRMANAKENGRRIRRNLFTKTNGFF